MSADLLKFWSGLERQPEPFHHRVPQRDRDDPRSLSAGRAGVMHSAAGGTASESRLWSCQQRVTVAFRNATGVTPGVSWREVAG